MSDFDQYAHVWWESEGPLWTLHALQRLRAELMACYGPWHAKDILDVGCGGGLFAESMMQQSSYVTAFDTSAKIIACAREHLKATYPAHTIDYRVGCSMDPSMYTQHAYDAVCAFEVIEHVDAPERVIDNMITALRPGGLLFLSSPNRTSLGFISNIIIPEYIVSWLPVGTHRYHMFVALDTVLAWLIEKGCEVIDVRGLWYYPLQQSFGWSAQTAAHYTIVARKI